MKEWYGLIFLLVLFLFEHYFKFATPSLPSLHWNLGHFLRYLAKILKDVLLSSF